MIPVAAGPTGESAAVTGPPPVPFRSVRTDLVGAALPVLVGVVATAVAWVRLPPAVRDTLWAEDAALFLAQRLRLGPIASLVQPYDGYQHLVPRLLTDLASATPVADYAHTVTVLCCLVVGLVAAATVVWSRDVLRHPATRVLFALVPVLTPVVAFEVLGNTANLHTFLLFLVPVLLLVRPRTWRASVFPAVVAVVVAMSEIQAVFFLPLLLVTVRHRRAWPIGGGLFLGLVVQLLSAGLAPRVRVPVPQAPLDVVTGWFLEPLLSVVYPEAGSAATRLAQFGPELLVALTLVVVAALTVVLVGRRHRGDGLAPLRTLAITLFIASPLVWGAGLALNPTPRIAFGEHGITFLGQTGYVRYAAASSMFLLGLVVLAAERLLRSGRRSAAVVGALIAVLLVGLLAWRAAPGDTARTGAPTWDAEFRTAQQQCAAGADASRLDQAPRGWNVTLDCSTIRSDAFPAQDADTPVPARHRRENHG